MVKLKTVFFPVATKPVPAVPPPKGMFETVKSGNITANGTEQTLLEYEDVGRVIGYIDLSEMDVGDSVILRQYMRLEKKGAYKKYAQQTFGGFQDPPLLYVTPKETDLGIKFTLEQTAGAFRCFIYDFMKET